MSVLFVCGFDWPRLIALVGYKLIQINFSYNLSGVKKVCFRPNKICREAASDQS